VLPVRHSCARWRRICEVSSQLLDSPPALRDKILARECADDNDLRERVLEVCGNYSETDDLFGKELASPLTLEDSLAGQRIGAWNVLSLIGEGGMGRVYLVERADGVFTQLAALKMMREHSDPAAMQRFQKERSMLAMVEHPSIARAIDGGATDSGTPYFVMEYVEGGQRIDEFRPDSPIKDKVRLFLQVVEAVEAAHLHKIAHRDLKPANILVTPAGLPKVLDFGIAKRFVQDEALASHHTHFAHNALTPTYASPEQLLHEPSSLLSDIYSLGAVLYKILTGKPAHDLTGLNLLQAVRLVTESQPVPPSALNKQTDDDLDAILMKAMERNPSSRYASATDFADDLRRYLAGMPVNARKRTLANRAIHLVRRRRWLASAAALCLLLALGVGMREFLRWREASERLEHLRKTAGPTISEYQSQLAKLSGNPLRLDRIATGEKRYLDGISEDAAKDPDLRRLLASAYGSLASYPLLDKFAIEDSLIKSMSHWREVDKGESTSADRLEMARTWRRLGGSRINMGKLSEAGRWLDNGMRLLESLSASASEKAGEHERVIMLLELSRLSARVADGPGAIENAQKAVAEQEKLFAKSALPHKSGDDIFEVSVKDKATGWKKTFPAANEALRQYAATMANSNSDGPVAFSFQAKSAASNDFSSGNSLAGINAVSPSKPSPCVENAVGLYQWTTDNRSTTLGNGKLEQVGFVKLTSDHVAVTLADKDAREGRPGVWKINDDCQVTINWQNGRFIDILTLSNDGKQLTGTSQIGTIITGTK
jgi:serine/threonine protein kinase